MNNNLYLPKQNKVNLLGTKYNFVMVHVEELLKCKALVQHIGHFGPEKCTLFVPQSKIMSLPHQLWIKFWID